MKLLLGPKGPRFVSIDLDKANEVLETPRGLLNLFSF